jgi:spore coat polysaccharide biosynthesis predicted glycosyltransferase SpsG
VTTAARRVLFIVAAGPRVGFGHLRRSRALAHAFDVPHVVLLRGSASTARAARAMGAVVLPRTATAIARFSPDLVVIDDPSAPFGRLALAWARRAHVPVASVHDLGRAYIASDLRIDASITSSDRRPTAELAGPAFTILDPVLPSPRAALGRAPRVLIALGGGAHVRQYGAAIAQGICDALPHARVVLAPGFQIGRRPRLPERAEWLDDPTQLASELARCAVAVVAGGVTLGEACAVGTPIVALAVAPAQRRTIAAFASAGAVFDAGRAGSSDDVRRVVAGVMSLTRSPALARRLAGRAHGLVDGLGACRVAAYLSGLVRRRGAHAHAA